MKQVSDKIFLPSDEEPYSISLYLALKEFGLPDDKFSFAPARGGVLSFLEGEGLIWITKPLIEAFGASIESHLTQRLGNKSAESAGSYGGGILGAYAGTTVATATIFAGLSGGLLAIPIVGGAMLGAVIGKNVMKKIGLRDPPSDLSTFSLSILDHVEVISSSFLNKMVDSGKSMKNKILFTSESKFPTESVVLTIVPKFSPWVLDNKQELKDSAKKSSKKKEKDIDDLVETTIQITNKIKLKDKKIAMTFSSINHLNPLLKTLEAQGITVLHKK
jgi:hypothetical protein